MTSCNDIIDRLRLALVSAMEWLAVAQGEAQPGLDWVNEPPGSVDLGAGDEDNLAALVQQVSNLGGGFDLWEYVERASPGATAVMLPVVVDPALTRVYLNGVPLAAPADYSIVDGDTVALVYALEQRDRLLARTFGG